MIDFLKLDYKDFEILVGLILKREGYSIIHGPPKSGVRGPDYQTESTEGLPVMVEVKHSKRSIITRSELSEFAADIERYRQQKPNARGLIVFSSALNHTRFANVWAKLPRIEIWDGNMVAALLDKHRDLEPAFHALINAKDTLQSQIQELLGSNSRATELTDKIRALPCGKDYWREFERICTEILTYVFTPDLAAPEIQSRSDDGLDIIDAIFPIRSHVPPWSLVRSEYRTRFVVAEFKNYCHPIDQRQVESLAQYLWQPAQRFFGLIVSRKSPSPSAIAQRRRKWLEDEKCIAFLDEEGLVEMLQIRDSSGQPFDIIDAQLEEFFRSLTP